MLIFFISVPGFYFLLGNEKWIVIAILALFAIASSLEQANTAVTVVENYPIPARYTGLSFGYNMGVAIFGGTAPLMCEWLISKTGSLLSPAIYVSCCALFTGLVVLFFVPETKGKSLE
jgi:MHS family proline/betaine transporter-like MFS transporter